MSTLPLDIIGPIGSGPFHDGVTFESVRKKLAAAPDVERIDVVLHGPGGSVFEGFAIFAELDLHPAPVHVEIRALAASIHSLVAMAAEPGQIKIHKLGRMMIHKARGGVFGTDEDAKNHAAVLASLDEAIASAYAKHTIWKMTQIVAAMAVPSGTWLTAKEAKASGLASEITEGGEAVNRLDFAPLEGLEVPADVRQRYDVAAAQQLHLPSADREPATLAGQVLAYLKSPQQKEAPVVPSPSLLALVSNRLEQLRSNA